MSVAIHYRVEVANAAAHLFRVTLTLAAPAPSGVRFALPVWIPGSYMIREFAKNLVSVTARQGGTPVALQQLDKQQWQTVALQNDVPLEIVSEVYAWDLSVRCAHLDQTHGFFNGTQLFFSIAEYAHLPCQLEVVKPTAVQGDWQLATGLSRVAVSDDGFGVYLAADYDELVDCPVEMGAFQRLHFTAVGVPHEVVVTGAGAFDSERLVADLTRICTWQIAFFAKQGVALKNPPFDRYVFFVMAVGEGYGGLEHRNSTALLCARQDLPMPGVKLIDERYRTFLGLCSHEYFHSWNVKCIKPAAFLPYRFEQENYTRLLWVFEGFTSYYDDLCLLRCGLIDVPTYLGLLAKTITGVLRQPGRLKQSVAASSFDAWTKYYRQDENAPNAIVSYYAKGSLVALALDLTIRRESHGERSLDDVMRYLWQNVYGADRGVAEDEMPALIFAATGVDLTAHLALWADGCEDLPLASLLADFGVSVSYKNADLVAAQGWKVKAEGSSVKLTHVLSDSAAQLAGLSAGDELIAIAGLRVTMANLESLLLRHADASAGVTVHYFRLDCLHETHLVIAAPRADEWILGVQAVAGLRLAWLGA